MQVFTKNVEHRLPGGLRKKAWVQHVWERYVELHREEPGFGNPAPVLSTPVDEEEEIDRVVDDFPETKQNPEIARVYLYVDRHTLPTVVYSGLPTKKFFDVDRDHFGSVDLEASRLHLWCMGCVSCHCHCCACCSS